MARFRGTVRGNREEASRLGSKDLMTTCNGWDRGVSVIARKDSASDADVFDIDIGPGSGYGGGTFRLASIEADGTIRIYNSKGKTVRVLKDLVGK